MLPSPVSGESMGNARKTGLTKRGEIRHLDKQFRGVRIRESTGTRSVAEAVALLAHRIEGVRRSTSKHY